MKGKNGEGYITNAVDFIGKYCDTFVLQKDGTVLGAGGNGLGEVNSDNKVKTSLIEIPVFKSAIKVSSDENAIIAILQNSDVYIKGFNKYGNFGNNTATNYGGEYKIGNDINDIVAYGYSTAILKEDQTVWTSGYNGYGQLGLGDTTDKHVFTKVQYNGEDIKAKYVKGCKYSLIIVDKNNNCYYSGYNGTGMSTNSETSNVTSPILMKDYDGKILSNVINIQGTD